jgi:nicotinate phosphoribosyltransferase
MSTTAKLFFTAADEEIKKGETTDIYFRRTKEILQAKKVNKEVIAEVTCGKLPRNWSWGILSGIEEVAKLFENVPVDIDTMPEGTIFRAEDPRGIRMPVMNIRGNYKEFCELETPLLGFICQSSGVSTAAARIKKILLNKQVISFGIRRMHPAISPMLDRAAFIGGFDSVSGILSAKRIGIKPSGTMPHALIIVFGDQVKAWLAYDEVLSKEIPRIALCDTYLDEKIETVLAAKNMKRLDAVRLDTPWTRKGQFNEIINEVRWELNIRGYKDVKIFISGGLSEDKLKELKDSYADGFGVGTSVSNAPTIDFAMNIVEIKDKKSKERFVAKRGVFGGEKQAYRCESCFEDKVVLVGDKIPSCEKCKRKMRPLLKPLIKDGKIVGKLPKASEIRKKVLRELKKVELDY